jgi:hypothetical protein
MTEMKLLPYRVEWRSSASTHWCRIEDRATRDEADALAAATLDQFGGFCRLITQHVISFSDAPGEWEAAA